MLQHGDPSAMTYYVGANVEISPNAAVASGAVLKAAPDSQLVIESGVCIGAGVIIQAYGGKLILAVGANVGQGALLLGAGMIGPQACIGAESTLINPNIEANQVLPARSLFGDTSRSHLLPPASAPNPASQNGTAPEILNGKAPSEASSNAHNNGSALVPNGAVYGREQVMKLVQTLFPHRDALMSDADADSS